MVKFLKRSKTNKDLVLLNSDPQNYSLGEIKTYSQTVTSNQMTPN